VQADRLESFVAALFSYPFAGRARLKALAALLALMLAACGKYGPLEPPPDPNAPPKPANTTPGNMNALSKPSIPPIVPPKQPFFLDFLLK
jgi:predicted small lipoprotein YifL